MSLTRSKRCGKKAFDGDGLVQIYLDGPLACIARSMRRGSHSTYHGETQAVTEDHLFGHDIADR